MDGKVKGVEEVLVAVFDTFALGFGHEVEVDRLASDDGTEGAIFHDNEVVAEFRDEEGGLGGDRVFDDFWSGGGRLGRLLRGDVLSGIGLSRLGLLRLLRGIIRGSVLWWVGGRLRLRLWELLRLLKLLKLRG